MSQSGKCQSGRVEQNFGLTFGKERRDGITGVLGKIQTWL